MSTDENDRPRGLTEHHGADAASIAREDLRASTQRLPVMVMGRVPVEASKPAPGWVQCGEGWVPGVVCFLRGAPTDWTTLPYDHELAMGGEFGLLSLAPGADADAVLSDLRSGDVLEGLAARILDTKRPELALDPLAVAAAAELRVQDGVAFDALRRRLKAAGVAVTAWTRALDARQREVREAERETSRKAAAELRVAAEARRAAEREASQGNELAAHYGESEHDGEAFVMSPGRTELRSVGRDGEETTRTLAYFSAPMVEVVSEYASPDAEPTRTVVSELRTDRESTARRVELSAEVHGLMLWASSFGATVGTGPGVRELLRCAIERLSSPTRTDRYHFTGWVERPEGRCYLSAGEVIGATGARVRVDGLAAGYALPPPAEGDALVAGLRKFVSVLALEPRDVLAVLLGAAFRATLGPSRCAVHLVGAPALGKTFTVLWFARLFGPRVEALDWTTSTALGLKRSLAAVGEAVVVVDDLRVTGTRSDDDLARRADELFRGLFNRTAAAKGRREGGVRAEPRGRCLVVSTGEVLPSGHSLRSRVALLEMRCRAEGLPAEDLSGVMAAFLSWLAPQVGALQEPGALEALDRGAAKRAGLSPTERVAEVFGAVALGLETFARFAAENGVVVDLPALRRVVATAAGVSLAETAAENPAARALELLGSALRSGAAHVRHQRPDGRTMTPDDPSSWGWETDGNGGWRSRGPCVGYTHHAHDGELLVDRNAALPVLRHLAQQQGHPLPLDAHGLAVALHRLGALARVDGAHLAVKVSLGGARPRLLAVRLAVFDEPHTERVEL